MILVLDGSYTLAWCFEDETNPAIDATMLRAAAQGAIVPAIWRLEVANGLNAGVRRGRLTSARRDAVLAALAQMGIATDPDTDRHAWSGTVRLADAHGLTIYDASYLELAIRRNLPLATLDAALVRAANGVGLAVIR